MNEAPRLFDINEAAGYFRSLGASGVTAYYVRTLVTSGRLPRVKLGRKFYISKRAVDEFLSRAEKKHG